MKCHDGCGACCIVPSISSPIPGMPGGKPSGVPCIHLTPNRKCALYGHPDRPRVCVDFQFEREVCGNSGEEAMVLLKTLEG